MGSAASARLEKVAILPMTRSLLLPVLFVLLALGLVPARATNVVESRTAPAPASAVACSSAEPPSAGGELTRPSGEQPTAGGESARPSGELRAQDDTGAARKDDPYPAVKHATV